MTKYITGFLLVVLFLGAGCAAPSSVPQGFQPPHITSLSIDSSGKGLVPRVLLEQGVAHAQSITDYTCHLHRTERLGGKLNSEQELEVRFIPQPYAILLKWLKNPGPVERALYIKGENKDKMLVVPVLVGMLTGPMLKDPAGPEAMKNSRRPITEFGFGGALQRLLEPYRTGQLTVGGGFEDRITGQADVFGQPTWVIERSRKSKKPVDDNAATGWVIYLDKENGMPIAVTEFNQKQELLGHYVFSQLSYNTGLTVEGLKAALKKRP